MKKSIATWQFAMFSLVSFLGTVLHFLYDWTNGSTVASLVSGVNESTWEHMKILFFPLFLFAIIESRFFKEYENFWCIKLIGTTVGLILIPVLFYTYNGAFGKSPDWLNISIFFISAAMSFILETYLFKKDSIKCRFSKLAFLAFCVISVLFFVFTFYPPHLPLFLDPLTQNYGRAL